MKSLEAARVARSLKRWLLPTAFLLGISALPGFAHSQNTPTLRPEDLPDVEAFLDDYFRSGMHTLRIPGAVVIVVREGAVFLSRGYGYADLDRKRLVDPYLTLFRVASVTKLLTATAVMQLVERGKLDLHQDVNSYLRRFQLEANFPAPVTLDHLLTHTAGFDERFIGMAARSESELAPLKEYLAARMPPRVLAPGDVISYSNHGMALAGYVVEAVSGIPFAQYVNQNIFQPLGMERSSLRLPPRLAADLARGYEYKQGSFRPVPYDYLNQLEPSGALHATAADIARFMIAHLQQGRYGEARILNEPTAREMHRQQFTQHPRLPGFAYGFSEHYENGQRLLTHGGSWRGFSSLLFLLPEHGAGVFVACNRQEPKLSLELMSAFLNRYFPTPVLHAPARLAGYNHHDVRRFAGSYRSTRYARRSMEKLGVLPEHFRVVVAKDATLTLRYPRNAESPTRWFQVERLLFQREDRETHLAFREDPSGYITHMFLQAFGSPVALERLAWYETPNSQIALLSFVLFFFLSASVGWPSSWLIRLGHKPTAPSPRPARLARLVAGATCGLNVIFFVVVELAFQDVPPIRLEYGMPGWLAALFVIPFATSGLAFVLFTFGVVAWKNSYWSMRDRVHYTLVAAAALAFIPFLLYWNLLGFRF